MKVEGSYTLKGSPATLFKLLSDPQMLGKCIPGCKELQEVKPTEFYLFDIYGYKGEVQVEKVYSPSRLGRGLIGAARSFLSFLKMLHPKALSAFTKTVAYIMKVLKVSPPSFLRRFQLELVLEGKGTAGTMKGTVNLEMEVQRAKTLVKYSGNVYLGGPAALLTSWAPLEGGLDPQELLLLLFNKLEIELATVGR
jgi:carbon monoxide dehydrogenase subunit G